MKALKLTHDQAQETLEGKRQSTWRMYDDKEIHVGDNLELIDKVNPQNPSTWRPIGVATITEVHEKRLGSIATADYEDANEELVPDELLSQFQKFYGPQVTFDTPVKIIRFTFHKPTAERPEQTAMAVDFEDVSENIGEQAMHQMVSEQMETLEAPLREANMYADGGSRGNPGPSASGYAIFNLDGKQLLKEGVYLGVTTNNQAEYQALRLGMEHARKLGIRTLHVYMDSLLVVNQMLGRFKVKNRDLWPIHDAIKKLIPEFAEVTFTHVPRELNKVADAAVNEALDAAEEANRATSEE